MLKLAALTAKAKPDATIVNESALALGVASIGIGLAEILAPRMIQGMLGLDDEPRHRGILQILGVREILHGVALLAADHPSRQMTSGIWSRVAGDVLVTALLGVAATKSKNLGSFTAVAAAVGALSVADMLCAIKASQSRNAWT